MNKLPNDSCDYLQVSLNTLLDAPEEFIKKKEKTITPHEYQYS